MATYDYEIQGNYGGRWEYLIAEETLSEAKKRLQEYEENEPQYAHRIKKVFTRADKDGRDS